MPKPILCLDFDGVLHSYTGGWLGADQIPSPPVAGAREFCIRAVEHFVIVVHSSRGHQSGGARAIAKWLDNNNFPGGIVVTKGYKPAAFVTLDDRALQFQGFWPDPKELLRFRTWQQAGQEGMKPVFEPRQGQKGL